MKKAIIIVGTAVLLVALLFASALIPSSAIQENTVRSAEYIYNHGMFPLLWDDMEDTLLHYYADSMLLNIAYHFDSENPISSALKAEYYDEAFVQVDEEAYISARDDLPANTEYIRYWHGSLIFVRPLLTIMTVQQMRWVFGGVMALFLALLCIRLIRDREYLLLAGVLTGFALTLSFLTPLVLEYTWCPLIMLIVSYAAIKLENKDRDVMTLFAISGIVTNFFDFLTTETMTLTLPLLLVLAYRSRKGATAKKQIVFAIEALLTWGIAYAGMWMAKWLLASAVLGISPADFLSSHVAERGSGEMNLSFFTYTFGGIARNIAMLLPMGLPKFGSRIMLAAGIVYAYFMYVYHKKGCGIAQALTVIAIGLIPYGRYILMRGHSYEHYFFTYRAQIAGVLALFILLRDTTEKCNKLR